MILFIGNYLSSVQQADIAFFKTKIRPTKPAVLPEFENVAKIIMEEENINSPSTIRDALKFYIKLINSIIL